MEERSRRTTLAGFDPNFWMHIPDSRTREEERRQSANVEWNSEVFLPLMSLPDEVDTSELIWDIKRQASIIGEVVRVTLKKTK